MRRHVLTKDFVQKLTRFTCRYAPLRAIRLSHALGVHLLTSALGDVITATSSVDVTRQSADVIVD